MIVHILGSDSMFTKDFYKMISTYFPKEKHCFVGNYMDYKEYEKLKGCVIIQSNSPKMIQTLYQADDIIIHGLFNKKILYFLALQPWLVKKCVWTIWGADIYSRNNNNMTLSEKIIERIKKSIAPKFKAICILSEADYAYAKKWYSICNKVFRVSYPVPASNIELAEEINRIKKEKHDVINIQIGNSATQTNQHIEALDLLAKFKNENIRIYLPLSYGNKDYREYGKMVIDYAKDIFGNKVIPLTERMSGSDYLHFLNTVDIGIFNNNRQQAMGNISQLSLCGAKVYIRGDISMWEHFKSLGYILYKVEEIKTYETIENFAYKDNDMMRNNRQIVNELHNIQKKVDMWSMVFQQEM